MAATVEDVDEKPRLGFLGGVTVRRRKTDD
jgi:hypothetical protein